MIYAIRRRDVLPTLVEFNSQKELYQADSADTGRIYRPVTVAFAHSWVKAHRAHETGLYVDQGRIRYAHPDA